MKSFVSKKINRLSNTCQKSPTARIGFLAGVLLFTSTASFGQSKTVTGGNGKSSTSATTDAAGGGAKSAQAAPTKEEQAAHYEKLAAMHTKMSECLKSAKSLPECQQEYTQTCTTFPKGSCSVLGDPMPKGVAAKPGTATGTATGTTSAAPKGTAKVAPKAKAAKTGTKTTTKK